MSPILVRPVREQLEHDRVIRFVAGKFKKRYDVSYNVGQDRSAVVRSGTTLHHPDVVLTSRDKGRKLLGVIEVETGESVNYLEALAQWAPFSRLRAPFSLYIPTGTIDQARRLCADNQVAVSEIWTYHSVVDEMRVSLAYRAPQPPAARARRPAGTAKPLRGKASGPAARPGPAAKKPVGRGTAVDKAKKSAKPARRVKPSRPAAGGTTRRTPAHRPATKARQPSKRR